MEEFEDSSPRAVPASSPVPSHVLGTENKMAGAQPAAEAAEGHGDVSPLPILERIEAEMVAELLAQLDTQRPSDSQEISCGQVVASPVHLDDTQLMPSQEPPVLERVKI